MRKMPSRSKPAKLDDRVDEVLRMYEDTSISVAEIAKFFEVSSPTIYRIVYVYGKKLRTAAA